MSECSLPARVAVPAGPAVAQVADQGKQPSLTRNNYVATPQTIDLIRETISHYVIHFRTAKAHECPLAAVYTAVSGEA